MYKIGSCFILDVEGRRDLCAIKEIDKVNSEYTIECVSTSANAGKQFVVSIGDLGQSADLNLGMHINFGEVVEDDKRIYYKRTKQSEAQPVAER